MPAFAAITLNDGTADIIFTPRTIDGNGVAKWETSASYIGTRTVVTSSVTNAAKSRVVRVKQKVVVPIADPVDASAISGEIVVNIDVVMPKNCSSTYRTNARNFLKNLAASAVTIAAIQDAEHVY